VIEKLLAKVQPKRSPAAYLNWLMAQEAVRAGEMTPEEAEEFALTREQKEILTSLTNLKEADRDAAAPFSDKSPAQRKRRGK
jgi:hypothetical protein